MTRMSRLSESVTVFSNGKELGRRYVRPNGDIWQWCHRGSRMWNPASNRSEAMLDATTSIVNEAMRLDDDEDKRKRRELANA